MRRPTLQSPKLIFANLVAAVAIAIGLSPLFPSAFAEVPDSFDLKDCAANLLKTSALDPDQANAIAGALPKVSNEIQLRVLSKTIAGKLRTVVLMGENHIATHTDILGTKPVIDQFKFMGTEEGDTNYEPSDKSASEYFTMMATSLLIIPEMLAKKIANFTAGSEQPSPMDFAKRGHKRKYVFNLEKGREWNWNLASSVLKMGIESFGRSFCIGTCALQGWDLYQHALKDPSDFVWIAGAGVYLAFLKGFVHSWAYPDEGFAALTERDPVMARNIEAFFTQVPDETTFLAIVGRLHIDGLVRHLTEAGFELSQAMPPHTLSPELEP